MMIGLRALVLNPNFLPISIFNMRKKPSTIPVEDAMTRIFAGTCEAVFHYDREILTQNENVDMKWPSVNCGSLFISHMSRTIGRY